MPSASPALDEPTPRAPRRRAIGQSELVELVQAAREGDERAWTRLVTHFSVPIRSVARRHRLSAADQEDVVQDTWLRLVERINSLREPAALPGWLVTTARREALDVIAGSGRERPASEAEHELANASGGEDVHESLIARERRLALRRAIEDLPNRQRELLQLMMAQPALSYEQVGERLGLPIGSIGPTRGRSMSRLRRDPQLSAWAQEDFR